MTAPKPSTAEVFLHATALTEVEAPQGVDNSYEAMPQYVPWPKAYGGDPVAQSAAAAWQTVTDDRELHSQHSSFLRPIDIGLPVRYDVERIRDGRGYSTRHIRGYQHDKIVFMSTASFQVPQEGPTYSVSAPQVPKPEELPTSAEYLASNDTSAIAGEAAEYWSSGRGFDMRHVSSPLYLTVEGERVPHQALWVKAFSKLDDNPRQHRIAIAYVTDYTILEPTLRALGLTWSTPGLTTASLDHSVWFHRHARADEWLLYVQEAAGTQSARGLNIGRFFGADGELIATVAQEGLVRVD